ncbi:Death-associated inhibitor of apoptosis 1 [Armadillidium vulgare]|nr:Death-associated inhibitor of apoptosis 1 [Armadillidium vulgare]
MVKSADRMFDTLVAKQFHILLIIQKQEGLRKKWKTLLLIPIDKICPIERCCEKMECQAHVFPYSPVQNRTHNTYCLEETSNTNLFDRRIRKLYSPYHFSYEVIRRATFDSWAYDYINKDELAKAGFYCLKRKDHVQCYFCKGIVGVWEEGDRPLLEHEKHFPNCPLVQGLLTSNVPLVTEVEENNNLNAVLNKCLLRMLEGSQLPAPYSSLQKDSCKGNFPGFAYPNFQSRERRLHTLTKWPREDVPSPEDIADAGFFYAGNFILIIIIIIVLEETNLG